MTQLNRWIARLAFSFFMLAALLAYRALSSHDSADSPIAKGFMLFGAMLAGVLGAYGVKVRHTYLVKREDDIVR